MQLKDDYLILVENLYVPYFLVAAGNDQPQVTGSCAKLRTDSGRDPDVDIVDPRLEMQLEFSHKAK